MNYEPIIVHMLPSAYEVVATTFEGRECLIVTAEIAGKIVELIHFCETEFSTLPKFYLKDVCQYPALAHVIRNDKNSFAFICVNDLDAVSVNFERPELAFEESLTRHIKLLNSALDGSTWNEEELLREFKVNWGRMRCHLDLLFSCAIKSTDLQKLAISLPEQYPVNNYREIVEGTVFETFTGITAGYIGVPERDKDTQGTAFVKGGVKREKVDGLGYVIPLQSLAPAPDRIEQLADWYVDALNRIDKSAKNKFQQHYVKNRAKVFWLVFNAPTLSGRTWFGIKLSTDHKRKLPYKTDDMNQWQIEGFSINVLNKELVMPRSGANTLLDNKKVLLVGCGSVGSELAMKLGSAGVGYLDIYDNDTFSLDNLYRHTLSKHYIGQLKAESVASELTARFPWIEAKGYGQKLLELRQSPDKLADYYLIIIAIGAPTQERLFHRFMVENHINTPVINTWLEGYGIGGHATLDIPQSKGCLGCAYVENKTGVRGLGSNLNFFQKDQEIVRNIAGCGDTFIPYGAASSAQTALIAAELAIKYLEGRIGESQKVSWKGDATVALEQGIALTPRYDLFEQSLLLTPLYNAACRDCRGAPALSFEGQGVVVHVSEDVYTAWQSYRQMKVSAVESAGLLIGRYENENEIWLDGITTPKKTDYATPTYFKLDDMVHQLELTKIYNESEQSRGYFGTWHTHPQEHPVPSKFDKKDWRKHVKENKDRRLVFVIVGRQSIKLFAIKAGQFKALQLI